MKRIILLLSVICLICGSFVSGVYADDTIETGQYYIEFLDALGIIEDSDYTVEELSVKVSRGEFASMLADALLIDGSNYIKQYWDVDKDYEYANQITALTELGYLSGYGDGSFGPYNELEKNEALIMALCALGYKVNSDNAELTWRAYSSKASELDLDEDINGAMTLDNAFRLLYNMLNAYAVELDSISGDIMYAKSGDETLVYRLYGISSGEGIVQAAGLRTITKAVNGANGIAVIDDKSFDIGACNMKDMPGWRVTYFYDEDDTLIYCFREKKQSYMRIEAEDIVGFANMELDYYKTGSNTRKTVDIPGDADIVYNGAAVDFDGEFSDALMKPVSGYIELIDNDNDDEYEVILINESYNIVVQSMYEKEEGVYSVIDKYDAAKNITVNTNEEIELVCVGADGADRDIASLYKNDIVTVYKSMDSSIISLFVAADKIEAAISEVDSNDRGNGTEAMIDGVWYDVAADFADTFTVGKTCIVYFDVNGRIAAVDYINIGDFRIGLLIYTKYIEFDDKTYVRLLDADGNPGLYECAPKTKIDGQSYSDANEIYSAIINGVVTLPSAVRFKLNADGYVSEIDTPALGTESADNTIVHRNPGRRSLWYKTTKTLSGHYVLNDSTVIFSVPQNKEDYDDYKVISSSKLGNDKTVDVDVFSIGTDGFGADALVIEALALSADYGDIAIVCKKIETTNEDDEVIWNVKLSQKGEMLDCFVYKEDEQLISGIDAGDIIRFSQTASSELDGIVKVYDYSDDRWCYDEGSGVTDNPTSEYTQNARLRLFLADVYEVSGDYIGLCRSGLTTVTDFDIEAYRFNEQWYVYETEKSVQSVRRATIEDIVELKYSPSDASRVIIQTQYAQPQVAYIIKR